MTITVESFASISQAASAMRDKSQFLGGGTLLVRGVNYGAQEFDHIICSSDAALYDIRSEGSQIFIGAGATMAQIIRARDVAFLEPVARSVGGPAIRNMATIGGNLFARSPFGDFGTALLALDATVQLSDGQSLPIETFYAQRPNLRALVAGVLVPRPDHGAFRFKKITRTRPKGASILSIAAHMPGSGRISHARIAFGAMGETPLRAKEAEAALQGAALDQNSIQPALDLCLNGLAPKDDAVASAWYRQSVAPVHLRRLLLEGGH